MLQSFHNDQAVKDKYVARMAAHIEADNLVRGIGWEDGKGCAVGCTLENYDHKVYETEIGLPEWLAHLEDKLFEGMSVEKSRLWPKIFLENIPLGVSEERFEKEVKAPFLVMILKGLLESVNLEGFNDVKAAINGSIAIWERQDIGSKDWKEAANAAARAADVAYAADVADAARAAEYAARAAARAAAYAARAAAYAADAARAAEYAARAYDHYADELIRLLKKLDN